VLSGTHTILARRKGTELLLGLVASLPIRSHSRADQEGIAGGEGLRHLRRKVVEYPSVLPGDEGRTTKIADCLTSLDEVIGAHVRKVEVLRLKRKASCSSCSRRTRNATRLRFPEFRNAPAGKNGRRANSSRTGIEVGEEGLPIYAVTMTDGLVKRSSLERSVDELPKQTGTRRPSRMILPTT